MTIQNKFTSRGTHFTKWKFVAKILMDRGITKQETPDGFKLMPTYGFTIYATDNTRLQFNLTEADVQKFLQLLNTTTHQPYDNKETHFACNNTQE